MIILRHKEYGIVVVTVRHILNSFSAVPERENSGDWLEMGRKKLTIVVVTMTGVSLAWLCGEQKI